MTPLRNAALLIVCSLIIRFGNVLIGWCPGEIADLVETMTDNELSAAVTDHLKMFFGKVSFKVNVITSLCLLMCVIGLKTNKGLLLIFNVVFVISSKKYHVF